MLSESVSWRGVFGYLAGIHARLNPRVIDNAGLIRGVYRYLAGNHPRLRG